jgi:hypothetical protein
MYPQTLNAAEGVLLIESWHHLTVMPGFSSSAHLKRLPSEAALPSFFTAHTAATNDCGKKALVKIEPVCWSNS